MTSEAKRHLPLSLPFSPSLCVSSAAFLGEVSCYVMRTIKKLCRTSLVAQWLRIRLPMQGTQFRALVCEDPTCHRTAKPVRHNC